MRNHFHHLLLIISTFSSFVAPEAEDQEDISKSIVLINAGIEFSLPICAYQRHGKFKYTLYENEFEYHFCPPKKPLKGDYENCLIPFGEKADQCTKRVEPIITPVKDSNGSHKFCSNSKGKLYIFAFHPCRKVGTLLGGTTDNIIRLRPAIMYDICYDHIKGQTLWVSHKIHSAKLLTRTVLKADREKEYDTSTKDFGLFNNRFEELQKSYSEERKKGKLQMQYIVPPEHMAFRVWNRAVYHYINTILVLEQTARILKHVDQFIQQKAIDFLGEVQIVDSMEFSPSGEVNIWSKTVYNNSLTSAILILVHNSTKEPTEEDKLCSESICSKYGWGNVIPENLGSYIYCCRVNELAKKLWLLNVKHVLNLKSKWRKFFKSYHHFKSLWC